jgi:signal transduction histidine kinase
MKISIQTKLIASYVFIVLVAILIVSVVTDYSVNRHFKHFHRTEMNGSAGEPPEGGGLGRGGGRGERRGYLAAQKFLSDVKDSLVWAALGAIAVAVILSLIISRRIVNPTRKIIDATKEIAAGDYSKRVEINSSDEIGELGIALNRMAESLEKIETMRRELVSNVSHELATPLTNISGYLEALHDKVIKGEEPTRKTLELLREEAQRLTSMVTDLRELSAIESSTSKLNLESVNLNELMYKITYEFKPRFRKKGIIFSAKTPADLPEVKADKNRLVQIIVNLLNNAISYTPDGGKVEISAKPLKGFVEVEISDTGIGIPEKDIPHIFERFYRGDKSRSRETGGTGIGLAIVKELVQAQGGEISVKSDEGRGTAFRFTIPMNRE